MKNTVYLILSFFLLSFVLAGCSRDLPSNDAVQERKETKNKFVFDENAKGIEYEPVKELGNGFESSFLGIGYQTDNYEVQGYYDSSEEYGYKYFLEEAYGKGDYYLFQPVSVYATNHNTNEGTLNITINIGLLDDYAKQYKISDLNAENVYEKFKALFDEKTAERYSTYSLQTEVTENASTKLDDEEYVSFEAVSRSGEIDRSGKLTKLKGFGIDRMILFQRGQYLVEMDLDYSINPKSGSVYSDLSDEEKEQYARERFDEYISQFFTVQ